ncbi:MAG: hypothetical protein IJ197_05765 [Bacteroidaceae bacterium]|nr:hypothetical protein [Bacteroidaceae bacterium]
MRELTKGENLVFRSGALLMVAGAALFLADKWVANVLFGIGVLLFVAMQLRTTYDGRDFTIARLRRQQLLGAVALVLAAVAMTSQNLGHNLVRYNEWVVCLLIGAIVELYTTFRLASELEKENKR